MTYLVIELKDKPHILVKSNLGEVPIQEANDPVIFKTKQDAFRAADKCEQGLVYPIIDVMKVLNEIKNLCKKYEPTCTEDNLLLDELLALTDEII